MNILKDLLAKDSKNSAPRPLFSQLKTLKRQQSHLKIKSPEKLLNSFRNTNSDTIKHIAQNIQTFKRAKAIQIARRHLRQGKSIDDIAFEMKNQIQYEALCIIEGQINKKDRSGDDKDISTQGESTIKKSFERSIKQTPNFDNTHQKKASKDDSAISEFTLGNRQKGGLSNKSVQNNHTKLQNVSQFSIIFPQKTSKTIKNRIINANNINSQK